MTIISSQRFLDDEIVERKIEELQNCNATSIIVPVINAYFTDLDGNDLFVITDKHHTLAAARELGLEVMFEEVEDEISCDSDIKNHNGEAILESWFMDSNWYYIHNDDEDLIGVDVW